MSRYSLLAYLGPRLIVQLENLATEALWYLLHTYTQANDAINSVVQDLGVHTTGGFAFSTQVGIPEHGIPDLEGKSPNEDSPVVLIEAKFGAPLTQNQPEGYLSRITSDSTGIVIFLIPEARISGLWPEVKDRAKAAEYPFPDPMGEECTAFSVRVSPNARLGYVTWSFLLTRIEAELHAASESLGLGELWQLQGLCQRLIDEPVPGQESPPEQLAALLRLLVDDLVAEMSKKGYIDTKGYRATPGPGYYRRYGTVFGQLNWFVEYSENNAHQFGKSLLWLGCPFSADVAKALLMLEEGGVQAEREGDNLIFPLSVSSESSAALVPSLLEQVSMILEHIGPFIAGTRMNEEQYQADFYQQMRLRIREWLEGKGKGYKYADHLLAAPDLFHLLCRLVLDSDVPAEDKAKLTGAILYFVSPFDFFPEALVGNLGYIDDIVVAALVLNRLVNEINPEIVKRHWAGDDDLLALIQEILKIADQLVGAGLWERIKTRFGSQR